MAANLDLNLLPVARYAGREYPELLCLHVSEPPRRRARGREADRLILYLAMFGNAPLPPGQQEEALADLSKLFYNTPGSVTSALRRTAEELNKSLLERNLSLANSSRQGLGVLVQAVLRGVDRPTGAATEPAAPLTLAISGPAKVFQISSSGVEHFYDASLADRGLGQSKSTPLTFFQATLQSSDTLLLAAQQAAEWSDEGLARLHGQGPESLRRRLFGQAVTDVNAVLVQARPGKGSINLPRPHRPGITPAVAPPEAGQPRDIAPAAEQAGAEGAVAEEAVAEIPSPAIPPAVLLPAVPSNAGIGTTAHAPAQSEAAMTAASMPATPVGFAPPSLISAGETPSLTLEGPSSFSPAGEPAQPASVEPAPRRRARTQALGAAFGAVFSALAGGLRGVGSAIRGVLSRILPEDALASIPSSVMAFTAIAAPVIIVSVATMVYGRLGTTAQYDALMMQARQIGQRGMDQTDIPTRYADLTAALNLLSQAETFGRTVETEGMRAELVEALDEMELALRVEYEPAISGGLPPNIQVKRITANEDDLFLLDGVSGNVLHARMSGQGYELDRTYICGPSANIPGVGALTAIAAWPSGYKPEGNLLAMDEKGGVLVCKNGGAPKADRLTRPSAANDWGQMAGFALEGDAYVLDRPSKGVWIYPRSEFTVEPTFFFNDEIPDVQDVVDLAVNRDDLYLLHADGSLTLCFYSTFQGVPTRCSRPSFQDLRPGRENQSLIPPTPFIQIQNAPPPDPSLFLLEPKTQAIYHFSLRSLAFQRQYMPAKALSASPATAFFVDNLKRRLFLAAGGQVYYAVMP